MNNKTIKKAIHITERLNLIIIAVFTLCMFTALSFYIKDNVKVKDNKQAICKDSSYTDTTYKTNIVHNNNVKAKAVTESNAETFTYKTTKTSKVDISEYEMYEDETTTTTQTETTTVTNNVTTTSDNINNNYSFELPSGNTSFFAYMDYSTITDTNSYQYKYQVNYCYTDNMGLRRNQYGDYVIALGSYYGTEIGTRYSITLDNGTTFTAVLGDCKADIHTDVNNQYRSAGFNGEYQNVIEFIVDNNYLSNEVKNIGNIGAYDMFNCNSIISISKI